jgi:hypothetical protein
MDIVKIIIWFFVATPIFYIATCSYISAGKSKAFELVNIGDPEESVVRVLGNPSVRETADTPFNRYIYNPCTGECRYRLWFENRLGLDAEAWLIELDNDKQVVRKSHLNSP